MIFDPRYKSIGPSGDSATSQAAAKQNFPISGQQRLSVVHQFVMAGDEGCTRDEVQAATGFLDSAVDARVWELKQNDWLAESDEVTRPTRTGRSARVLKLTAEAVDYLLDEHPELLP